MLTLRWQRHPGDNQWWTVSTAVPLTDRPVVIHLGLASPQLQAGMERLVARILQLVESMKAPITTSPWPEPWQPGPAEAYRLEVVLGDGRGAVPLEARLRDAVEKPHDRVWALPLLPADPPDAATTLPKELRLQHTTFWQGDAIEDCALTVLARAGITSLDRRVFISYRRTETQPMADQLFEALSRLNYSVYLDTVSNHPGLNFQEQLFEHLVDMSMVVLLHSTTFDQSTWTMAEVEFAVNNNLSLLILRLPGMSDLQGTRTSDQLPLHDDDLISAQPGAAVALSAPALERVLKHITEVHDLELVARRGEVRQRTIKTLQSLGLRPRLSTSDTAIHLHAADGSLRQSLLPISRPPGLADLHDASTRAAGHFGASRIVVGRTAVIPRKRREQLSWVAAGRNVAFHDVAMVGQVLQDEAADTAMSTIWAPKPPLAGATIFLSASVPHPQRDARFLQGPLEEWLMLRVIDQRVFDAVQCLVAQQLAAGGRLVHGGHPTITHAIAAQAGNWRTPSPAATSANQGPGAVDSPDANGTASTPGDPPVILYQSEFFAHLNAPPGRDEMRQAGFAAVRWSAETLAELKLDGVPIGERLTLRPEWIEAWLPQQAAPGAPAALREALLAMRLQMLLETQPPAALCIGGMEGIEAEARLYTDLCDLGLLPGNGVVHVLASTFGAAAQLGSERVRLLDGRRRTTPETAREDLQERLAYDIEMREFVAWMGGNREG
jgi:hypothetical protein